MGVLNKTRAYLVGSMEFNKDGESWRSFVTEELSKLGIVCFTPYKKPFIQGFDETDEYRKNLHVLRENSDFDELSKHCKEFRMYDLNLVDRSDFIIFYYDLDVNTVGSFEEFFWANRLKKPIFLVIKQGKKKCPFWFFGTIPHRYIYDSIAEVVYQIKKIDSGEITINQDRWRLLHESFR